MDKNKKEKEQPSPLTQPKEVVRFEKSTYPDLITGYPIEYYNSVIILNQRSLELWISY